jgi:two-component system chemotaxis response regulator CheB
MIRVLIVDDSAVVRKILTEELSKQDDIEVVGSAVDPYVARDKIIKLRPDVLTLDVEMPRMDGLSFLAKLMQHYPLPVVIVSSITPKNSQMALRALSLGAVEVICKPGSQFSVPEVTGKLARAIRAAAAARLPTLHEMSTASAVLQPSACTQISAPDKIVAIGASTGGTRAIEQVLSAMPANAPGTVIVQHMPEHFTAAFAKRLNQVCQMEVREAQDCDPVLPGVALVAPGHLHMLLYKQSAGYSVRLKHGPPVHHQRPSVDVLFQSVARHAGRCAIGVILTGMGADGAKGLLDMRQSGAYTLAEHEMSCVVFGMPREAIKLGAVDDVVPLSQMAVAILRRLAQPQHRV